MNKNEPLTILGYTSNQGMTWYKCKTKVKGKTRTGYISGAYIIKGSKVKGEVNKKVKTYLNLRKSAKSSSKSLMKIKKGTKVTVYGIKKVSSTYWYKIKATYKKKTKTGYVDAKYITIKSSKNPSAKTENKQNDQTGYVNDKVASFLNVRKLPSTTSSVLMRIPKKTKVIVHSTSGDWYNITVTYNGKTVTGYVAKEYITIDGTVDNSNQENQNTNTDNTTNTSTPVTDAEFETMLAAFPESYKPAIRNLRASYPNWRFIAVNTNLDWATVIANESVVGRNVIQSNYPKGTATLAPLSYLSTQPGAYDWSKDKYHVKDGSNWYSANSAIISYYMDPRNFLNDTDIFQFEALAFDQTQSSTVVQSILNNTFMSGNYSVLDSATNQTVTGAYTQAFMDAGKGALANPYFLASRSKQEVGVNGSAATSGVYKGYEGIYNYYNIGAYDGGDAVAKGLLWAKGGTAGATTYGRPWTNPYKSIVGGAQYIAANYINVGQNTLYFQKFNVVPTNPAYVYLHQYMTNVQAPYAEGRTTRNAYSTLGILGDSMVFYIPYYNNMPETPCAPPMVSGNPNPFLKDITVYNGNTKLPLTPTFAKPKADGTLANATYSLVVPNAVSRITIGAAAISGSTTVSGTGTYDLTVVNQPITFQVVGTAENGSTQVYTINITRLSQ